MGAGAPALGGVWAVGPPHDAPGCQTGGGSSATIRLYNSGIQMGKWPNYPSTVNSSVTCCAFYYCLAAQDESLRKQHLLTTAWNITIFCNGLVLAKTFAPFRHAVPCMPSPAQPFSAAVQRCPYFAQARISFRNLMQFGLEDAVLDPAKQWQNDLLKYRHYFYLQCEPLLY